MNENEVQHWLSNPVIAAAAGALVGLRALPGSSYLEKASNMAAGFAIAAFGGPALVEYLGVQSAKLGSGIVFVCGAVGLVVANAVWEGVKHIDLAGIVSGWLRKKGE